MHAFPKRASSRRRRRRRDASTRRSRSTRAAWPAQWCARHHIQLVISKRKKEALCVFLSLCRLRVSLSCAHAYARAGACVLVPALRSSQVARLARVAALCANTNALAALERTRMRQDLRHASGLTLRPDHALADALDP
eukprot:6207874-Pleurochrysis_carterae.AAC.1